MPRVSDTKERLTEAAMGLIWENSYGATSVELAQARIHNDLEPIREFKYWARDILGVTQGVAAGRL